MTGLAVLLSHWARHKVQAALLLMGLALATALWTGVQAINAEARASYDFAAATMTQDRLPRLVAERITLADYVALRRAGWPVSPVIEGEAVIGGETLRLIGIEPLTLPPGERVEGNPADFLTGGTILSAAPLDDPRARRADLPPGIAVADIGVAAQILGPDISYLLLTQDRSPQDRPAPAGYALIRPATTDLSQLTESFHLNLAAFGYLAFGVGLFIVHSAIGLAFEQRRALFRTLRALGLSARALTGLLLAELLAFALVAGAAGVALGWLIAGALLPDVASTLRGLYGAEVGAELTLRPVWWLSGLGIAVLGMLGSAGQSLWRLWRLPPLAPAQPRAWARESAQAMRRQALAGALLLGLAAGLLALPGLWAGFGMLAGLLMGCALILPMLLASLTRIGQWLSRGAVAQWFWADTRQQLPGLSLALMALLLALAANIGVGTMVGSFRATFTAWIDQRLAADLYVEAADEADSARLLEWLGDRAVALPMIRTTDGGTGVVGMVDHPLFRRAWPLLRSLPDPWAHLDAGDVFVNEQLALRRHLSPGDRVEQGVIAGIYPDYGNPMPQVILSYDRHRALYPLPILRHALITDIPAAAIRAAFPRMVVQDRAAIREASVAVFERTFAVTAALNVLTLGVAALAIFASLLTLSALRLPQLAPVWAMGLRRSRLAWLEWLRTLALAALVWVLALPVGLALAWVLLAVVNVEAFGWRLPMRLFPGDWLRLGGLSLLAAGLAAALPVYRLARIAPAELLKVFARER
ncbi:putative ABC transport system permease protein [Pseudochelatococcus lubricantis]|uniref:ABC transport system permease protein n=1 Tax=Pseudochelatococcus lubricantis TaxID=1538102 RepID=A0ABX0V6L0_9HYPH|nr:ABC transporter permease [Pseudochelatococcus lubricantis]NIJ60140.1 putative ABC transport system permease protein [Pseudochelatococcus lubricantis]